MEIIIFVIWFLIFIKLLFFWLWLWQLKEYHFGRFKAHFETQAVRKILSGLWRIKYPKFTLKIIIIFLSCLVVEILLLLYFSFLSAVVLTFFLIPLLVLFFEIPSVLWRQVIMNKARKKRAKFKNLLVIGITGSYGKTSTKEFLAEILSSKFRVSKTKEHRNSEIGISQCVLNDLKEEHEVLVVEMAAYNKGGIKLLCDIVKPAIGIITGVNEQHLATFGTMENLLSAEGGGELIESLPEDGMVFLNGKDELCRKIYQEIKIKKYLYGEKAELLLENIEGAKAVAKELGMSEEEIAKVYQGIKNKFPGIEIKKGIDGLTVIDATYSANPTGVMAHLDYLETFSGPEGVALQPCGVNKKVIIMPCLIELGSASKEIHKRIGRKIKEVCDLAIITTKDRFKEIAEGALLRQDYGGRETKILFLENPKEILAKIENFCQGGDVALLEGRISKEIINALIINSVTD